MKNQRDKNDQRWCVRELHIQDQTPTDGSLSFGCNQRIAILKTLLKHKMPITRVMIEAGVAELDAGSMENAGGGKVRVHLLGVKLRQLDRTGLIEFGKKEGNSRTYILTDEGRKLVNRGTDAMAAACQKAIELGYI